MAIKGRSFLKVALLVAASAGLSGCVYDVGLGLGLASDGYYDDAYACDPYGGYDAYYNCDYAHAFSNIGFGGGWYDNYYYPGHGIFLFDTFGRRYSMREQYRRYWGERRHNWYREYRRRDRDGTSYQGRNRNYSENTMPSAIRRPERDGGRIRDGDNRNGRGNGQAGRQRNEQWHIGTGNRANAAPVPNPEVVQRPCCDRGEGYGRPNRRSNDGLIAAAVPQQDPPRMRPGGSEDSGYRQPITQPVSGQDAAPAQQTRAERIREQALRERMNERSTEQPQL
jgi:hypothetical protein